MARIRTYALDNNVTGSDYWIGTDGNDNSNTKNFSPNSVAKYLNENEVIDISNSIRFRYDTIDSGQQRKEGTISFQNEIGATVPMSNLTSFVLSKKTQSGKDVSFFLNALPTTKIIIHKSDDINIFGLYKVVSFVVDIVEPNFFNVSLEFISGHGSIEEDKDYIVSLIDLVKTVPVLQLTKETFNYSSSSSFTLSNTIQNVVQVIINTTSLHPEGYSYSTPSTVTILNQLYAGDVITIVYNYLEEFFEVPNLQMVTNVGNHTTNDIVIDGPLGSYVKTNTITEEGSIQSATSVGDYQYQSEYLIDGMSVVEIVDSNNSKNSYVSAGVLGSSLYHNGGFNSVVISAGISSVGPSVNLLTELGTGRILVDNITLAKTISLQFPDKPSGTYTIATTSDIPEFVNHWTKTGNNIYNNNYGGVVLLRGFAGGYYEDAFKGQFLQGGVWTDGFRVQNGGNFYYKYGYGDYSVANTFGNGSGSVAITTTSGVFQSNARIKYATDLSSTYDDRTLVDKAYVDSKKPYKVYTAIINQVGTNAPTTIVLENTLGGTVVWTYNNIGNYTGTLSNNGFTENKTVVFTTRGVSGSVVGNFFASWGSTSTINVTTSAVDSTPAAVLVNNALTNSQIEIRVYN